MNDTQKYFICALVLLFILVVCFVGFKIINYRAKLRYIRDCKEREKKGEGKWTKCNHEPHRKYGGYFTEGFFREDGSFIPSFFPVPDCPYIYELDKDLNIVRKLKESFKKKQEEEEQQKEALRDFQTNLDMVLKKK